MGCKIRRVRTRLANICNHQTSARQKMADQTLRRRSLAGGCSWVAAVLVSRLKGWPVRHGPGKDRMHDDKTVQRFIDLRVQGWVFTRIAAELNVSKTTLIAWSRQHQHTIANLIAIERENCLHRHLASGEARLQKLGDQLRAAEAELAQRDLTTLSTGRLLTYVESLQRRLQKEAGPMRFVSAVDQIPEDEYADRIQVWNP